MRTLLREAESRRIQAEAKAKRAERNAAATTVELDALRADCTPTKDFVLSLSSRLEESTNICLLTISERGLGLCACSCAAEAQQQRGDRKGPCGDARAHCKGALR